MTSAPVRPPLWAGHVLAGRPAVAGGVLSGPRPMRTKTVSPKALGVTGRFALLAQNLWTGTAWLASRRRSECVLLAIAVAVPLAVVVGGAAAVVSLSAIAIGPRIVIETRESRRRTQLERQLATAVELLARALGAGRSLRQAFGDAELRMSAPLGVELATVNAAIGLGQRPAAAFAEVTRPIGSDLFDLAAAALEVHERSGGQIVATLRRLASIIRDRRVGDAEVASLCAQGRLSGVVVGCLPLLTAAMTPVDLREAMPLWLAMTIESIGWGLVLLGVGLIWRMTTPSTSSLTAGSQGSSHACSRVALVVGRLVPASIACRDRSAAVITNAGVAPADAAVTTLTGERVAIAIATGFAMLFVVSGVKLVAFLPLAVIAGWFVPELRWRRRAARLRASVESEVPKACDLLVLNMGGGANLSQAVSRTASSLPGPLGDRFRRVIEQLGWGARFEDALTYATDDIGSDDLDEVVATLLETRRSGGEVAGVLDQLAADMRLRARLRKQGEARRLSVKILLPLVFCVLPAFGLLTVVPMVAHAFSGIAF